MQLSCPGLIWKNHKSAFERGSIMKKNTLISPLFTPHLDTGVGVGDERVRN